MKKVLVIEDDIPQAEAIKSMLKEDGYEVILSTNGDDGLIQIRLNKPDLVILDIMLPILDGLTLCRMIQRDESISYIPIIMLTARGSEIDKIVGLESGADDYIVKPLLRGEFLARASAAIRRAQKHKKTGFPVELVSGTLSLNLLSRRVHLSEKELVFTNKEFDLLAELMKNKNVVLSRDLLLTKVWGFDSFVDKRTVDVHVRWLREKIEDDPSDPRRITTIRGVGYRFEDQ